jgi:hypothetical protein
MVAIPSNLVINHFAPLFYLMRCLYFILAQWKSARDATKFGPPVRGSWMDERHADWLLG